MRTCSVLLLLMIIGCGDDSIIGGGGDGGNAIGDRVDLAQPDGGDVRGPSCGGAWCQVGEVCEAGVCRKDCGQSSVRCGDNADVCCGPGEVCYLGACAQPGAACKPQGTSTGTGLCGTNACPDGQYCEASIARCLPLSKTVACEYRPPTGDLSPKIKWAWSGSKAAPEHDQIMMTPMVGDLDGDCMPDIVFATFRGSNYTTDGVLRAVRGDGSRELWSLIDAKLRVIPNGQVALGDVDNDGRMEVFACSDKGALMAFGADGSPRWRSSDKPCQSYDAPLLADLMHDGAPEVIVGFEIYDARSGKRMAPSPGAHPTYTVAAELDGDTANGMELIGGGMVVRPNGQIVRDPGVYGFSAVADLDLDGKPDYAVVAPSDHSIRAFRADGSILWGPVDVNNSQPTPHGPTGGGPPTIADFDGDGKPEVATAAGYGYLVLRGATGKVLWQNTQTRDWSSRVTGSSVFDFEGDGSAEAVYNDELNLRVYRGADGRVLLKQCNTSGTLFENPVIVDVDADDHAEIVVVGNNYQFDTCDADAGGRDSTTGFMVIGDARNRWVRTRRIWNQHTYHVTNVGDDGRIPREEASNWTAPGLNNFRQNVQTRNLFAAPDFAAKDLTVGLQQCGGAQLVLYATVVNQGAAGVGPGLPVTFYWVPDNGQPTAIGTVKTSAQLLPGAGEKVSLVWSPPGTTDARGPYRVYVVVDDGGKDDSTVNECDEGNNRAAPISLGCPPIG